MIHDKNYYIRVFETGRELLTAKPRLIEERRAFIARYIEEGRIDPEAREYFEEWIRESLKGDKKPEELIRNRHRAVEESSKQLELFNAV